MKIYVAAPWIDREYAKAVAGILERHDYTITHPWWNLEGAEDDHAHLRTCAIADVNGVATADVLMLLNTAKSEGKAVEQGLALAWMKPIVAVGILGEISTNVFHHLPQYIWVDTVADALDALVKIEELKKYDGR
jgi:hypothetical protein